MYLTPNRGKGQKCREDLFPFIRIQLVPSTSRNICSLSLDSDFSGEYVFLCSDYHLFFGWFIYYTIRLYVFRQTERREIRNDLSFGRAADHCRWTG